MTVSKKQTKIEPCRRYFDPAVKVFVNVYPITHTMHGDSTEHHAKGPTVLDIRFVDGVAECYSGNNHRAYCPNT